MQSRIASRPAYNQAQHAGPRSPHYCPHTRDDFATVMRWDSADNAELPDRRGRLALNSVRAIVPLGRQSRCGIRALWLLDTAQQSLTRPCPEASLQCRPLPGIGHSGTVTTSSGCTGGRWSKTAVTSYCVSTWRLASLEVLSNCVGSAHLAQRCRPEAGKSRTACSDIFKEAVLLVQASCYRWRRMLPVQPSTARFLAT